MRLATTLTASVCFLFIVGALSWADDVKKDAPGTVSGVLIDQACGAKMMDKDDPEAAAAKHTKDCATKEACEKSGYAVISGKHMYKFNAKGNVLAKEFLAKTTKDSDIRVSVAGTTKGDEILVDAIVAAPEHK